MGGGDGDSYKSTGYFVPVESNFEADYREMLALLRDLEWLKSTEHDNDWCPGCANMRHEGHELDCRLGQLLDRLGRE